MERLEEIADNYKEKSPKEKMQIVALVVLRVVAMLIAVFLSWTCNANYGIIMRIGVSLLSAVFAEIYILYYLVYHILMGFKCAAGPGVAIASATKTMASSLVKMDAAKDAAKSATEFPFKQKSSFSNFFKGIKDSF